MAVAAIDTTTGQQQTRRKQDGASRKIVPSCSPCSARTTPKGARLGLRVAARAAPIFLDPPAQETLAAKHSPANGGEPLTGQRRVVRPLLSDEMPSQRHNRRTIRLAPVSHDIKPVSRLATTARRVNQGGQTLAGGAQKRPTSLCRWPSKGHRQTAHPIAYVSRCRRRCHWRGSDRRLPPP